MIELLTITEEGQQLSKVTTATRIVLANRSKFNLLILELSDLYLLQISVLIDLGISHEMEYNYFLQRSQSMLTDQNNIIAWMIPGSLNMDLCHLYGCYVEPPSVRVGKVFLK